MSRRSIRLFRKPRFVRSRVFPPWGRGSHTKLRSVQIAQLPPTVWCAVNRKRTKIRGVSDAAKTFRSCWFVVVLDMIRASRKKDRIDMPRCERWDENTRHVQLDCYWREGWLRGHASRRVNVLVGRWRGVRFGPPCLRWNALSEEPVDAAVFRGAFFHATIRWLGQGPFWTLRLVS